jgi:hypothetical protein
LAIPPPFGKLTSYYIRENEVSYSRGQANPAYFGNKFWEDQKNSEKSKTAEIVSLGSNEEIGMSRSLLKAVFTFLTLKNLAVTQNNSLKSHKNAQMAPFS